MIGNHEGAYRPRHLRRALLCFCERIRSREIQRPERSRPELDFSAAIYSYYASKEEMYGALLGESLERLNAEVGASQVAAAAGRAPAAALRAAALAFFDFFRENPRDLDLGFYLFQGMQPRGLTPELNERLNARLRDALAPAQRALVALGLDAKSAQAETTALFAHIVGLLVL